MSSVVDAPVNISRVELDGTLAYGGLSGGSPAYVQLNILLVNSTNADDLQLQWAQNGSSGTATTVYEHSHGIATKLA